MIAYVAYYTRINGIYQRPYSVKTFLNILQCSPCFHLWLHMSHINGIYQRPYSMKLFQIFCNVHLISIYHYYPCHLWIYSRWILPVHLFIKIFQVDLTRFSVHFLCYILFVSYCIDTFVLIYGCSYCIWQCLYGLWMLILHLAVLVRAMDAHTASGSACTGYM